MDKVWYTTQGLVLPDRSVMGIICKWYSVEIFEEASQFHSFRTTII
jgi:hypothetical protein